MDHLLSGLATRLGQGPFVADRTGSYHLRSNRTLCPSMRRWYEP
ncbi:hypothetical protein ACV34F_30395, partial [Pseudomonas aeruginosa]